MKNLIYIILLINSLLIYGQADSLVEVSADTAVKVNNKDLLYKLFVESRYEKTKHLWKVNLMDFGFLSPNLTYEHGIGRHISIELNAKMNIKFNSRAAYDDYLRYGYFLETRFKYYHNIRYRERAGRNTYGFSANYFAPIISYGHQDFSGTFEDNTERSFSGTEDNYSVGLVYGLQRRVGNIGYVEVSSGLIYYWNDNTSVRGMPEVYQDSYRQEGYDLYLGVKAGFSIDSFKNLKRMLSRK